MGKVPLLLPALPKMCLWRRVRNVYLCEHAVNLPDEEIKCYDAMCRFSPSHPSDCVPPQCTRTCWQYRQFPQQYTPHLTRLCPTCEDNLIRR